MVSSVTGCSTCSRVFISRKKKEPSPWVVGHEFDGARTGVSDGVGGQPGGLESLARIPGVRSTSGAGASSMTF